MNQKLGIALATGMGLAGFVGTTITAQAATSSKYLSIRTSYVRTKKAMTVGIKEKVGSKYKLVKVPKNTLLKVDAMASSSASDGSVKQTAIFTYGAIHYARAKKMKYENRVTAKSTPLTKANFKAVSLKAPIRTQIFRPGTGFKANSANTAAVSTSGFYLTLDNYLQYYSKTAMAKDSYIAGARWATSSQNYKPTRSIKVTKVTVSGNTTKIYYKKPLKGLPNKKIAKNSYRLTIKNLKTTGSVGILPVDDTYDAIASWTNYKINGKAYCFGEIEHGN
ncbi:hypothetical protein [Lactiplantibacillus mudanjiangensis]|uniref:Uncharacterized protein n=1 Tax=Lactiplantibacillus mudanjiangensis TaxID=1296538 RepID=A0A660DZH4_9LACO|nr:hypothetical protein [Lactiplantibacillus mudanjiangensis]VDG23568.1 hypothetical protein [Lactobacillus koreensis] [Lactiplantibacillus mudanjiangensis]VDG28802.1 hypothetical protein [Lactobacillus koreensis] [Lactiplantibacillus mudanjiangensis]